MLKNIVAHTHAPESAQFSSGTLGSSPGVGDICRNVEKYFSLASTIKVLIQALDSFQYCRRDGQWCRARVVAVDTRENLPPDQRNVEVTFVDYGETNTMKLSDTRKLKQDFLHLPFQAIECCLDRIYPPARAYNSDEFWSSAACDFLTDLAKVCLRQFFFLS